MRNTRIVHAARVTAIQMESSGDTTTLELQYKVGETTTVTRILCTTREATMFYIGGAVTILVEPFTPGAED